MGLKHARRMSFQRDRRAIWETSLESPLSERQLREVSDAPGSQSCGFGKPATSKLLLFQNLRLSSLAIRLICNINFREVDYPSCHRATLSRSLYRFLVSILKEKIDITNNVTFATILRKIASLCFSLRFYRFISAHLLKSRIIRP